jgi:hypothetical protein
MSNSQFLTGCALPAASCRLPIALQAIDSNGSPGSLVDSHDFLEEGLIQDITSE